MSNQRNQIVAKLKLSIKNEQQIEDLLQDVDRSMYKSESDISKRSSYIEMVNKEEIENTIQLDKSKFEFNLHDENFKIGICPNWLRMLFFIITYICLLAIFWSRLTFVLSDPNFNEITLQTFPQDCTDLSNQLFDKHKDRSITFCSTVSLRYKDAYNYTFECQGYDSDWKIYTKYDGETVSR